MKKKNRKTSKSQKTKVCLEKVSGFFRFSASSPKKTCSGKKCENVKVSGGVGVVVVLVGVVVVDVIVGVVDVGFVDVGVVVSVGVGGVGVGGVGVGGINLCGGGSREKTERGQFLDGRKKQTLVGALKTFE